MHGLINNWEWYDYIQVEICIHGFNNLFFFLLRENEPVLNMHEFRKFPQRGSKVQGGLGGGGQL